MIDYDKVREIAVKEKPKMIIAGASAYARIIDFKIENQGCVWVCFLNLLRRIFCYADTKHFNNGTVYFHENDKNKAITGWKFKNRRRIIKDNVY